MNKKCSAFLLLILKSGIYVENNVENMWKICGKYVEFMWKLLLKVLFKALYFQYIHVYVEGLKNIKIKLLCSSCCYLIQLNESNALSRIKN